MRRISPVVKENNMKRTKVSVVILFLGLMALAGASQSMEAAQDGQLFIRFSPTLAMDVGLVIQIDGRTAGAITRGHVFNQFIRAGSHRLTVKHNGRGFDQFSQILHVSPGQTYSYMVKLPRDQVVLEPSGIPR